MDNYRKYFIFRCKCCGNAFDVPVSEMHGVYEGMDNTRLKDDTNALHKTHICDRSTSLLGIGNVVGMTDNGADLHNYL